MPVNLNKPRMLYIKKTKHSNNAKWKVQVKMELKNEQQNI